MKDYWPAQGRLNIPWGFSSGTHSTAQLRLMTDRKTKIYVKMFLFPETQFCKWIRIWFSCLKIRFIFSTSKYLFRNCRRMKYFFLNNTRQWQGLLTLLRSCDFIQRLGKSWNWSQENYVAEKHNILMRCFSTNIYGLFFILFILKTVFNFAKQQFDWHQFCCNIDNEKHGSID